MPASLEAAEDSYDGIVISAEHLPRDADTFEELLAASLDVGHAEDALDNRSTPVYCLAAKFVDCSSGGDSVGKGCG